jgi:hypothetical protein
MSAARFTRRRRCPICNGADSDPRGKGIRCFGFLSSDGKYAHCSRVLCGEQENGGTWAHWLGGDCNCGTTHGEAPPPLHPAHPAPKRERQVSRDVSRIWSGLTLSDRLGEAYLESRDLWDDGLPRTGYFRFNVGRSSDEWVNARAAEGYRCAFAVRRPDGSIQTIVFRHAGDGIEGYGKAPALPGCSTSGAAICRPEIRVLLEGAPEFEHDEIALVEGPTSFVAFTLWRDALYRDGLDRPSWTLGCIGAGQAVNVVEAFDRIIAGRLLRIALDKDPEGEKNARLAADAAYRVGARQVLRWRPRGDAKDIADLRRATA